MPDDFTFYYFYLPKPSIAKIFGWGGGGVRRHPTIQIVIATIANSKIDTSTLERVLEGRVIYPFNSFTLQKKVGGGTTSERHTTFE
jgi:hypothetical protein